MATNNGLNINSLNPLSPLMGGTGFSSPDSIPEQVQKSAYNFAPTAGPADAYTLTLSPAPASYTDGMLLSFTANASNTTATPTINVNGLGAKTMVTPAETAMLANDISLGNTYLGLYSASNDHVIVLNPTVSLGDTALIQSSSYNYAIDTGIADAYIATLVPAPSAPLTPGMLVYLDVANANTGPSTLVLNGSAATAIKTIDNTPLIGGEMVAGGISIIMYSGFSDFLLLNSALSSPNPQNGVAAIVVDSLGSTPYTTIQDGINAAAALVPTATTQQTVWIYPGTYTEDLVFASYVNLACASKNGVEVIGNATHAVLDISCTNIKFSTNNINGALNFVSAGAAQVRFYNCIVEANGGTGIYFNSGSTVGLFQDTTVNSGVGGQCWDILDGTVLWTNPTSTNVDTASNIGGGVFSVVGGLTNDSYDLSAGLPYVVFQNTSFLSSFLPVIAISATASVNLIGGSMYTQGGGTTAISGTGSLSYSGVNIGPGLNFAMTLTKTGEVLAAGNISFDGGHSSNNIDGGLWIGSGAPGGAPTVATLTAGPGITITNGQGSIGISGGGGGIGWTSVAGTSQAMAIDSAYVPTNVALTTFTLPVTAAFGTVLGVTGYGSGGWTIAQNAGQSIQVGTSTSTVGVGGSVSSSAASDTVDLVCVVADTVWKNITAPQGILTVV